jgi:plastocyanin
LARNRRLAGDDVADPEQIYQEVLAEEQQKGSSPPVAEGRAKSARKRAEEGSPHPKEPKWWPGSQPHLEGGGEAAPEEAPEEAAPEPEPEPAAEEPAAEAPATSTPVAESPPAEPAEVPQDAQAAPAPAPVQPEAPAAAPAAAAATEVQPAAAAPSRPAGVTHGTTSGTRLRPEDEVTTDAQFDAQQAMHDRRKLIDDLVGTGVPVVTAASAGRTRAPMLVLLYLLIPLIAISYLVSQREETSGATEAPPAGQETEAPGNTSGDQLEITAVDIEFDTDQLTVPADQAFKITLRNDDPTVHNISIYEGDSAEGKLILEGQDAGAEAIVEESVEPLPKGAYFFQCDYHPAMNGTLTAE